jgi:hypothetical protein
MGRRARRLPRCQRLLRSLPRAGRPAVLGVVVRPPADLRRVLVATTGRRPPASADGRRARLPQLVLGPRVRRHAVVRSPPRHRLSRPHPPATARVRVARAVPARRLGIDRAMAAPRLSGGEPPRVRRRVGPLRPVGRRPPSRDPRVPDDGDVLGVPHVPGMDGAVGDAPARRRTARSLPSSPATRCGGTAT